MEQNNTNNFTESRWLTQKVCTVPLSGESLVVINEVS